MTAGLDLAGVPVVGQASTRLSYRGGDLRIERAHSAALGGSIDGQARIHLGARPRIALAEATGSGLDLSRFPHIGHLLSGMGDVTLSASGTSPRIRAAVDIALSDWAVAGDDYDDTTVNLRAEEDGSTNLKANLVRKLGGQLDLAAFLSQRGVLGGLVSMRKLPLETLTAVQSTGEPQLGAEVDAELQLSGTLKDPRAEGHARLFKSWFGSSFLGSAALEIVSRTEGWARLHWTLLSGLGHHQRLLADAGAVRARAARRAAARRGGPALAAVAQRMELSRLGQRHLELGRPSCSPRLASTARSTSSSVKPCW